MALNQILKDLEMNNFTTVNLEKKQECRNDKLQTQILALRKAFEQLGDSVMQETEKIRKDVAEELQAL